MEDAANQKVVPLATGILSDFGFLLTPTHRILEFGCGSGRHVLEWRESGFDAFGYDRVDYTDTIRSADAPFFRFSNGDGTIPFDNATFDLVHSTSVFEHVMDYDEAFGEIRRVLKPGGISLNFFPSRYRPIESHMYVPFGGVFQSHNYFRFWAALGIRNEYQRGMDPDAVALANFSYAQTGIRYLRRSDIWRQARKFFTDVRFVEAAYIRHSPGRSGKLYALIQRFSWLAPMYGELHTRALMLG